MSKSLHSLNLLAFLLIVSVMHSQSSIEDNHFNPVESTFHTAEIDSYVLENNDSSKKKVFSYIQEDHAHHDHKDELSLLDIISSDEGADFNCSGGFCMNKSHFHKKGLTIKKQLFVYFMLISC